MKKSQIKELIREELKYLFPLSENTNSLILESMGLLKEILLNPDNAVDVKGNINKGEFRVGDTTYNYNFILLPEGKIFPGDIEKNIIQDKTYDVNFHISGDMSSLRKGGKQNLIKIYSTMYKVILSFCKQNQPNYLLVSSFDKTEYFSVYNNLTKTNKIPGYSRKTIMNWEYPKQGKMTSIILKKN